MKLSWKAFAPLCVAWAAIAMPPEPAPAKSDDISMPAAAATAWLNSPPQTAKDLRGKVVVVQFWTYTCINWRRTLPYIRAWDAKYREQGLVVIGVHTPEFDFEENVENVRSALREMHIGYPIAIDNQHAIWNAFHNVYWPALYLLDAQGHIRYRQFGEGEYARTEREIQKLLAESGGHPSNDLAVVAPLGAEVSADVANLRSPETYVGYEMAEKFVPRAEPYQVVAMNTWLPNVFRSTNGHCRDPGPSGDRRRCSMMRTVKLSTDFVPEISIWSWRPPFEAPRFVFECSSMVIRLAQRVGRILTNRDTAPSARRGCTN